MHKTHKSIFVIAMIVSALFLLTSTLVFAKENPISKKYIGIVANSGQTKQYKVYKYTYAKRWTPAKTLKDQPSGGIYLKKGDALFYVNSNSGITASVTFAGLTVNVPLGKYSAKSVGVAKTADKNGYYVLKCKKEVYPYAYYAFEYRERSLSTLPWGPWKKCDITRSKGYEVYKSYPYLHKTK